eukprot:2756492-Karenia_brevis.AAC.1
MEVLWGFFRQGGFHCSACATFPSAPVLGPPRPMSTRHHPMPEELLERHTPVENLNILGPRNVGRPF